MKHAITQRILALCSLALPLLVLAQNDPQPLKNPGKEIKGGVTLGNTVDIATIELNLDDHSAAPDLSRLKYLAPGQYYRVHLKNINLNLYKVSINGSDSSTAKPIAFPTFGALGTDALSALAGGVGVLAASAPAPDEYILPGRKPNQAISDTVKAHLNSESKAIADLSQRVIKTRTAIDEVMFKVYATMLMCKTQSETGNAYDALKKRSISMEDALDRLTTERIELNAIQLDLAQRQSLYDAYVSDPIVATVIKADDDMKGMSGKISDAYKAISQSLPPLLSSVSADNLNTVLTKAVVLNNGTAHEYWSLPIQYTGGDAVVRINIAPMGKDDPGQSYHMDLKFPVPHLGYGGVCTAFYISPLHNEAFSTRKDVSASSSDTTTSYSLVQEDPGNMEFGVTALFTIGGKFKENQRWGGHFVIGPGASIADKVSARLLIGAGLSYGKQHMVQLNIGAIMGYVQERANVYAADSGYLERPDNITVATLKTSVFASLGYMFTF